MSINQPDEESYRLAWAEIDDICNSYGLTRDGKELVPSLPEPVTIRSRSYIDTAWSNMVDKHPASQSPEEMEAGLAKAVNNISKELARSKKFIYWLTVSLIFDICLSIILGTVAYFTSQLSSQANHNASALVVNCESSNQARALSKNLWEYILTLPTAPNPNETAAQKATQQKNIEAFKGYINKVFAPIDCSKINTANTPNTTTSTIQVPTTARG